MPRKPDAGNSDKTSAGENRGNRPDRGQGSGGSDFRQKGAANRGQGSGSSDFSQKGGAPRDQGPNVGDSGQNMGSGGDQNSGGSDYLRKAQGEKLAQEVKKGGCLPKLFMLLLPLVVAGTYLYLRS